MKRLRVTQLARRDLTEATAYIARENRDAAQRLRGRFMEAAANLASFPLWAAVTRPAGALSQRLERPSC